MESVFELLTDQPDPAVFTIDKVRSLEEVKCKYVAWAIQKCGGDKREAANLMKISEHTIYNLAEHWTKWIASRGRHRGRREGDHESGNEG
jgi:hypothetical protein